MPERLETCQPRLSVGRDRAAIEPGGSGRLSYAMHRARERPLGARLGGTRGEHGRPAARSSGRRIGRAAGKSIYISRGTRGDDASEAHRKWPAATGVGIAPPSPRRVVGNGKRKEIGPNG